MASIGFTIIKDDIFELRANLIALHAALDTPALRGLNKALLALVKEESGVAAPDLRRYL